MFVGAALGVDWAKVREHMTFAASPQLELKPLQRAEHRRAVGRNNAAKGPGGTLAASVEALKRLPPPSAPVSRRRDHGGRLIEAVGDGSAKGRRSPQTSPPQSRSINP
jgi:hypothetical protein